MLAGLQQQWPRWSGVGSTFFGNFGRTPRDDIGKPFIGQLRIIVDPTPTSDEQAKAVFTLRTIA